MMTWVDGSEGERHFAKIWQWLKPEGALDPMREYEFHPDRKFRFDFCFPEARLAVEIHGGTHSDGRHVRGVGFRRDREKANEAQLAGWRVLEFTTDWMRDDPQGVVDMVLRGLEEADVPVSAE